MFEITLHEGDCGLATALAAGRMMLQSAPLLTSCIVSVIADNGVFEVLMRLESDGRISETYEAYANKHKLL
jgi:hypothetical protein